MFTSSLIRERFVREILAQEVVKITKHNLNRKDFKGYYSLDADTDKEYLMGKPVNTELHLIDTQKLLDNIFQYILIF